MSQNVYGDENFKCIVMHDGSVLAIERKPEGGRDLTMLHNPSGEQTTMHISDAPTRGEVSREWITTEHHQELVDRVPNHKDRVVSYMDSEGIERAVWDNHCYMEPFRYEGGAWVADTVEDTEKWTKGVTDTYGEACLELEDRAAGLG